MAASQIKSDAPAGANGALNHPKAVENQRAHQRALDHGHREWVERAKKYDRMYLGAGKQWKDALRAEIEASGRPVLEVNLIMSHINAVLGEIQDQRVEWEFSADDDDAEDGLAEINAFARRVQNDNAYADQELQVVADGIVQDRGYFDIRMDFNESAMGRLVISAVDPLEVELSPEAKEYDPSTWPEVTRSRWMNLDDISVTYGAKHKTALEDNAFALLTGGHDNFRYEEVRFGNTTVPITDVSEKDAKIREARIVERQHKQLVRRIYLIDLATGDETPAPDGMELEQAEKLAKKVPSLFVQRRFESRIRWTVSCGHYLLHDEWSPYKNYTLVPFFPIFRRGNPLGLVANQVSPQEQVNKLESQFLHVINTTANSGWAVEAGSLVNMTTEELEERGAETGLVLVYRQGRKAPEKIQANRVPTGLDQAANKAANNLRMTGGVPEGDVVEGEASLMAEATSRRGRPVPAVLSPVLANLAKTRRMVASRVLDLIQTFVRHPAQFRTREFDGYELASKSHSINQPQPDGSVAANMATGRYEIAVTTSLPYETARERQFAYAVEMRNAGIMVPDDYILGISPLDDRKALAERSREMQGLGEPSEKEQELMAMQEQITVQRAMLELQELEATVNERVANAQLLMAKAGAAQQDSAVQAQEAAVAAQLRMEDIRAGLTKHMTNLQNKLELADMHINAKDGQTRLTGLQKRALEHTRQQGQQEAVVLQASVPRPTR